MAEYLVRHLTRYHYSDVALESHNLTCLQPANFPGQVVKDLSLTVSPIPEWRSSWTDVYGNHREAFSLAKAHHDLEVDSRFRVERYPVLEPQSALTWEQVVLPSGDGWEQAAPKFREFACPSPLLPRQRVPGFEAEGCFSPGRPVLDSLMDFMGVVHHTFEYDPEATDTFTPLAEVHEKRAGVCQDFAHVAIAELRRRGFAAGYVSGYLETLPPEGQIKLRGADATHAWYAVFVPGFGWVHYDPTNNLIPGERHVVAAWGRDYGDVAPVKGVLFGGGEHDVTVEVDVWSWPHQVPPDIFQTQQG